MWRRASQRASQTRAERCGSAQVCVRDHGPGVPDELIGQLTRPFFRLDRHSESLGLALVEGIARSLSGELTLSNHAPGLEARLTLPVCPARALRA